MLTAKFQRAGRFLPCAAIAFCAATCGGQSPGARRVAHPAAQPVIVELFTSEGCSSCPPADALLVRLDRQPVSGADVIVLSEHVDYWDRLGWKDRFSSHDFTERQQAYGALFKLEDIYTPQAVVNGTAQFNGADGREISKAIERAAASHAVSLMLTGVQVAGDKVSFALGQVSPSGPGKVDVFAALVEPATTTEILAGENQGRTLRQAGVVLTLENGWAAACRRTGWISGCLPSSRLIMESGTGRGWTDCGWTGCGWSSSRRPAGLARCSGQPRA